MTAQIDKNLDPIPISALQHWQYCQRQWGLIHLEQAFSENVHTLRGQATHKTVDQPGLELRKGLRIERALPIWSERIGLIGKADVVEFESSGAPYPVEYKHGARRKEASIALCDDIQLAAQALCLEEMTGHAVEEGALFYATTKRRRIVPIDATLRALVATAAAAVRQALATGALAPPVNDSRCRGCSLQEICQPSAVAARADLGLQLRSLFVPET